MDPIFWLLLTLVAVVGVKYYTSVGLRQLDRRLASVKRDLERTKSERKEKRKEQEKITEEEELCEIRIRNMKELISDLEFRLTVASEEAEEKV